ncbi:helix-turn-helix domain-containing protein [Microbulbifer echini]|uniref:Helix-turn-helix domain-containing protein n=1 Tax=Microbulbifer echini TaxID=1529067 RepID=A0ABV4NHK8_9GAMM
MGTRTNQLTLKERYQIEALHGQNYSARAIAQRLHRSNKTISRELDRVSRVPTVSHCNGGRSA